MAKVPQQERAKLRVDRMLDAFAQLLDEVGFDAVSTIVVAARSGSAVGSVYQFFRNKAELADALRDRLTDRLVRNTKANLDKVITDVELGEHPQVDMVDCFVALHHAMEQMHRHEPGAMHLPVKADQIAQELMPVFRAYSDQDDQIAQELMPVFRAYSDQDDAILSSHILVAAASSAACYKTALANPAEESLILTLCQWMLQELGRHSS